MISALRMDRLTALLMGCGLVLGASCAKGTVKTLVSGDHSVRIGSDGSVPFDRLAGGDARVGRPAAAPDARILRRPDLPPDFAPSGRFPPRTASASSTLSREIPLEVELTYTLKPGDRAVVFSREIALRSDSPLPGDLTVAVPIDPSCSSRRGMAPVEERRRVHACFSGRRGLSVRRCRTGRHPSPGRADGDVPGESAGRSLRSHDRSLLFDRVQKKGRGMDLSEVRRAREQPGAPDGLDGFPSGRSGRGHRQILRCRS